MESKNLDQKQGKVVLFGSDIYWHWTMIFWLFSRFRQFYIQEEINIYLFSFTIDLIPFFQLMTLGYWSTTLGARCTCGAAGLRPSRAAGSASSWPKTTSTTPRTTKTSRPSTLCSSTLPPNQEVMVRPGPTGPSWEKSIKTWRPSSSGRSSPIGPR